MLCSLVLLSRFLAPNVTARADVQAGMNFVSKQQVVYSLALIATFLVSSGGMAQGRAVAGPAGANPAIRMCKASDLSLGTDDENGAFNGMSHSGTLLVLRNLSSTPCRVPQRPQITFLDDRGKPLPVALDIAAAKFMHPGPVLVPVVVAPDAEVTAKLRWVAGEVYGHSVCLSPAALSVKIGEDMQQAKVAARLCGDRVKGVTFEKTPFAPDPVYTSPTRSHDAR